MFAISPLIFAPVNIIGGAEAIFTMLIDISPAPIKLLLILMFC